MQILFHRNNELGLMQMLPSVFLRELNSSKALGPDELQPRVIKELATVVQTSWSIFMSDKQHAFRNWHSCGTQFTTMKDDCAKLVDNHGQVDKTMVRQILEYGSSVWDP